MRFEDLQVGDVFQIDGAFYEAAIIGERIVVAYVLQPTHNFKHQLGGVTPTSLADAYEDTTLERQPDPNDLAGDQFLTTAFSDLRFNKNNLTDFERQCDEELKTLL